MSKIKRSVIRKQEKEYKIEINRRIKSLKIKKE